MSERDPEVTEPREEQPTSRPAQGADPLRGSRTSGFWAAVVVLVIVLVLLAVFVLQNTQQVRVSFFGWDGSAPLAAALLIATAAGLLIAVSAGALRILQLRRRVRRAQRH
ncbi:MAG TPA: lipopolysaccharide assembly protein LapA domain-containing protein [Marmoricola sp.]|nr:lipopolysaccharide assembly protein LapA domain-containing protein [Marmoricola sp.]